MRLFCLTYRQGYEFPNQSQQHIVADLMGHPVLVPPMPWKQCEPSLPYIRDRGASRYKGKMRTPSIEYQHTNAFSKKLTTAILRARWSLIAAVGLNLNQNKVSFARHNALIFFTEQRRCFVLICRRLSYNDPVKVVIISWNFRCCGRRWRKPLPLKNRARWKLRVCDCDSIM